MMIGISVKPTIGIGDAVQFTSVPENYFRATGKLLIDVQKHWVFDHNPYVIREFQTPPSRTYELWNYNPHPKLRDSVWLSLAEKHCAVMGIPVVQKYPRLYVHEGFPIEKREKILFHTHGKSHGEMPKHIIDHVVTKYKHMPIYHIGLPTDPDIGIPKLHTPSIWDLVKLMSEARIYIGMDSGPSWIANCYPDIVVKKLRMKPTPDVLKDWVPLDVKNIHAQWDDHGHQVYNPTEDDIGFTSSYRRL